MTRAASRIVLDDRQPSALRDDLKGVVESRLSTRDVQSQQAHVLELPADDDVAASG